MSVEPTEQHNDATVMERDDQTGSRRGMFAIAAGGLAAAALAACGRPQRETISGAAPAAGAAAAPAARPVPRQAAPPPGDLDIAAVAASLEQLAVDTYGAALDAAGSGALGEVPPAVGEFVTVVGQQHQEHLDAWNGVLTASGRAAVSAPPADLAASVNAQFGMVKDAAGAAQLALQLEQVAAATYLDAIGKLQSPDAIMLAGSIQPIDRQHISVLLFALGMYPVPEVFATTAMAYSGSGPMPGAPMMPETR